MGICDNSFSPQFIRLHTAHCLIHKPWSIKLLVFWRLAALSHRRPARAKMVVIKKKSHFYSFAFCGIPIQLHAHGVASASFQFPIWPPPHSVSVYTTFWQSFHFHDKTFQSMNFARVQRAWSIANFWDQKSLNNLAFTSEQFGNEFQRSLAREGVLRISKRN